MAFTMHSHSGQFCPGHAKDQLEDIIKHAISIGYKTIALTEHMPRTELCDLYPEELDDPPASLSALRPRHEAYLLEALRLRTLYSSQIAILIGFEAEYIRPSYGPLVASLSAHPEVDFFIGSLHHVCGVPIDFDAAFYARALEEAVKRISIKAEEGQAGRDGGEETPAGEDAEVDPQAAIQMVYYDEQHAMLSDLRPRVVGHFDLVRLLSEQPGRKLRGGWAAGRVWERVVRNLRLVREFGGWLECNTSALRKGLEEPYPGREIAEEWIRMGGKFTFSDDSHGIAQVATNYSRGLDYLESLGVKEVWTFESLAPPPGSDPSAKPVLAEKAVSLVEFRSSLKLRSS